MRSKMRTRIGSILLVVVMLLGLLPTGALAAESTFSDIQNHWGKNAIERWSSYGIVSGTGDGIFAPDADITRAEMAQVYVNLLGLTEKADISSFTDIPADAWYADAVAKCVAAGIFSGTSMTTFSPSAPITREQIFVTFGHAIGLQPAEATDSSLSDLDQVSDWAQGMVNAILEAGYVSGVGNNMLMPLIPINRASVMAMMDTAVAGYANESGTTVETEVDGGLVLVVADDVTVTGTVGDVVVAQGAGQGTVTLKDATVTGTVTIAAPEVQLAATGKTAVENMVVSAEAKNAEITVDKGASVENVTAAAQGTTVSGQGEVSKVEATEGSDEVKVTTPGTTVENNGSGSVTTDKGEVKPGESGTTTKPSTGGGSSSGGSVHSHSYTYTDNGNGTHTGVCYAGDSTLEPERHNTNGTNGTCSKCGAAQNATSVASVKDSMGSITYYDSLEAAITAATDGTVTLLKNVTMQEGILLDKGDNSALTLDMNGFTYTVKEGAYVNNRGFKINSGTLNVIDSSEAKTGEMVAAGSGTTSADGAGAYGIFRVEANGNLNVTGVTLKNSRPWGLNVKVLGGTATLTDVEIISSYGGGIEVTEANLGEQSKKGAVTMTNCTVTQTGYFDHCSSAVSVSGGSQLTVNGGTYTSDGVAIYVFSSGGIIEAIDGTFSGNKQVIRAEVDTSTYPTYTGSVQIKGGTYTGTFAITSPASLTITGGTFSSNPADYLAEGYTATTNDNGVTFVVTRDESFFDSGSGTESDPYIIANLVQLEGFRDRVNAGTDYAGQYIKLDDSIETLDLNGEGWMPIGNGGRSSSSSYSGNAFKGTFDGNDKTISGLTISSGSGDTAIGLFGVVAGGTVKNLTLTGVNINCSDNELAGGVAGLLCDDGVISGCTVDGSISIKDGAGGIVGRMVVSGTISDCVNNATVSCTAGGAAGIVGKAYYTKNDKTMTIERCTNTGAISNPSYHAGGISALCAANVTDCTNTGAITAGNTAGGIVAEQVNWGTVSGCTNSADIKGDSNAGGIIGWVRYQTGTSYEKSSKISVLNNKNSGVIGTMTENKTGGLGWGGIVGGIYNAGYVSGNENTAASITGGTFGAGIVGNLQENSGNLYYDALDIDVVNNVSTTSLEAITVDGTCRDLYAYRNNEVFVVKDNGTAWNVQMGEENYVTLNAAIANAEDGDVIKLKTDITVTNYDERIVWDPAYGDPDENSTKHVIIDLNQKTITNTYNSLSFSNGIVWGGKSTLTLKNGTIDAKEGAGSVLIKQDAKLIMEDVVINSLAYNRAAVKFTTGNNDNIMRNVSINANNGACLEVNDATVALYDCNFTQTGTHDNTSDWYHACITTSGTSGTSWDGVVNVHSGTYTGKYAVYILSSGGIVNIYGGTLTGELKNSANDGVINDYRES